VLDFGIAKLLDSESQSASTSHTSANRILGTPTYMSPEQCKDARLVDTRSDIYSLGCLFFEMLSGRAPFIRATFAELIAAHLWESPPSLSDVGCDIPPAVEALLKDILAKAPEARPATMDEVLLRIDEGKSLMSSHGLGQAAAPRAPWSMLRRLGAPVWLAGGSAGIGALALGWFALQRQEAMPPKEKVLPTQVVLPEPPRDEPSALTSNARAELSDAPLVGPGSLEAGAREGEPHETERTDLSPAETSSKAAASPRRARRLPELPVLSDEQRKL